MSSRHLSVWRNAFGYGAFVGLAMLLAACDDDNRRRPPPTTVTPPPVVTPPIATFTIGGSVSGLNGSVTLLNNGGDARAVEANGSFTFGTALAANSVYAVTVQTQPANQVCSVTNGAGTVTANVTNVVVACETVRATATIGAAGGTVLGPDGVQVEIPAGALTEETVIGVARASSGGPAAPTENLSASTVYEFTPHDIVFNLPVTIRMPVPAGAQTPSVMMASVDSDWSEVEAEIANGTAVLMRNTFSWGGIFVCGYTPGDPNLDPGGCVSPRGTLVLTSTPANSVAWLDPNSTPRKHRVSAASNVHFTFAYHVPASCINGSVRMRRAMVQANGVAIQPLVTLFEQGAPLIVNNASPPGRAADGSVTLSVPISNADNGRWFYQLQLMCTHRTGPRRYTLAAILEVDVAAAPPPPAPTVTYSIGGTVAGLTGTGLVLQNNVGDDLAITADGAFTFPTEIAAASNYSVSVRTQPTNPTQICSVQNGVGTAANHVTNVAINCVTVTAKAWQTPQVIDSNGVGDAESPRVGVDAAGNAIAVWAFFSRDQVTGNLTSEIWSNRYTRAGGWGTPVRVTQIVDGGLEDLRLAVLANGEAVAIWVQSVGWEGDIYSSRFVPGSAWTAPALVENAAPEAKSLSIGFEPSGNGFAVWLQKTGPSGTEDVWSSRYVAGTGWSAPVLLEQRDDGAGDPVVAASADGSAIAVWGQNDNDSYLRMNRYVPGTGWAGDSTVTQAVDYPSDDLVIAMDDVGRAVVAYSDNDFTGGVFGLRYAAGSWSAVESLRPTPFFYPERLTIAMRGSGEALILWAEGEGLNEMWAKPFGVLTGDATPVGDDNYGGLRPRVAFDADGTALAVWNYGGQVMASRYTHGAASPWSMPVQVAPDLSATDVHLAIDPPGNAFAVWQQNVSSSHSDIGANIFR